MRRVRDAAKVVLYRCGYYHLYQLLHAPASPRLLILMYHDIVEDPGTTKVANPSFGKPTRSQFAAHMREVAKRYRVLTLDHAVRELVQSGRFTEPVVAITFDDGYESVYRIAWPILKSFGFVATVFPITDWTDGKMNVWWEDLYHIVKNASIAPGAISDLNKVCDADLTPYLRRNGATAKMDESAAHVLERHLRDLPETDRMDRVQILQKIALGRSRGCLDRPTPLSWDQIREMSVAGVEFAAHTCSHVNLGLTTADLAEMEIMTSRHRIEAQTQKEVTGFCTPYGEMLGYSLVQPILKKHHFRYACPGLPGFNDERTDPLLLGRSILPPTTSATQIGRTLLLEYNDPVFRRRLNWSVLKPGENKQ